MVGSTKAIQNANLDSDVFVAALNNTDTVQDERTDTTQLSAVARTKPTAAQDTVEPLHRYAQAQQA